MSNDLSAIFDPTTWVRNWQKVMTQIGFININFMESADSEKEAEIISLKFRTSILARTDIPIY